MKDNSNGFYISVFEIVRMVPAGKVTTYGAVAKAAGKPRHARLVGRLLGGSGEVQPAVPAHRVVSSNGILASTAGPEGGCDRKELLEKEAIVFTGNRIKNFRAVFWDPTIEL